MTDSTHLAAIRARDAECSEGWFSGDPATSILGRVIQDRRFLLAELDRSAVSMPSGDLVKLLGEVGRLQAENERLRDANFQLRQRLANLHSSTESES